MSVEFTNHISANTLLESEIFKKINRSGFLLEK